MYIPPSTLLFLVFSYLLFLLSVNWAMQPDGAWYRPLIVCLLVIAVAAWSYREQHSDEL
jgi:hypothetical protein